MKQQRFEDEHHAFWEQLETALEPGGETGRYLPRHYRQVCQHLAVAKHRRYGSQLVERLNRIVMACHHRLYSHRKVESETWLRHLLFDFPLTLRANAAFVWLSAALFALPLLMMGVLCYVDEDIVYSVMSAESVRNLEDMYSPDAESFGRERQSDTDLVMFGFYINNNIGISFQVFASGIFFGIGSVFYLIFNGLVIGAAAGHITQVGYTATFFPFVVGHGAFELTAIVFSGAAGLMLGFALIAPGELSRLAALRRAAREAITIIYGSTVMLVIAAFLEAFWSSSSTLPAGIKYAVGAALWLLVLAYCLFAGRRWQGAA